MQQIEKAKRDLIINALNKSRNLREQIRRAVDEALSDIRSMVFDEIRETAVDEFFNHSEDPGTKLHISSLKRRWFNDNRIVKMDISTEIKEACTYLETFFSTKVKYIGPLRDSPKTLYPLTDNEGSKDVGFLGENVASVFELFKNELVEYLPPENMNAGETKETTLENAVINWLVYLGIADGIKTENMGKLGYKLTVEMPGFDTYHDLASVGVGVSQVLPIVVMCLIAEDDTTFLFEQPELHLHPRVQSRLGDFFLSLSLNKQCIKQCIIETHSEYLIDKIRYRIVEESDDKTKIHDAVKLYYAENVDNNTHFNELTINKYGVISEWPEGFFDETQKNARDILYAASQKRKRQSGAKNG
jgi:predicted ATPase